LEKYAEVFINLCIFGASFCFICYYVSLYFFLLNFAMFKESKEVSFI
jgi:hypothetical protein